MECGVVVNVVAEGVDEIFEIVCGIFGELLKRDWSWWVAEERCEDDLW